MILLIVAVLFCEICYFKMREIILFDFTSLNQFHIAECYLAIFIHSIYYIPSLPFTSSSSIYPIPSIECRLYVFSVSLISSDSCSSPRIHEICIKMARQGVVKVLEKGLQRETGYAHCAVSKCDR